MNRDERTLTSDGYAAGDRIVRTYPSVALPASNGTVLRVEGDGIVVSWDHGGFPQVLPLAQRANVRRVDDVGDVL